MFRLKASAIACVVAVGVLVLAPAPASAQTADGVCNSQTGAAYGLCTAYCEAMDCDSTAPSASPTACSKVYGNFQRLTNQAPPCVVPCPCADAYAQVISEAVAPASGCDLGANESQVHFGPNARLNLVHYTLEGSFCTAWNNDSQLLVSRSPLTVQEISACRSIIANACSTAP